MERFHLIDDAAAILVSRGVYKQAKLFRRGKALFAAHGAGFIRLYEHGTSIPTIRLEAVEVPGSTIIFDRLGRAELR
jgi:hypothetical protein